MGQQKGGKKLRRGARHRTMYAEQFYSTERNKNRRITRNNQIRTVAKLLGRISLKRHLILNRLRRIDWALRRAKDLKPEERNQVTLAALLDRRDQIVRMMDLWTTSA